jgi:serine protease Do
LGRVLYGDNTTLCTDVTLVGGDSGGPLFNLKGEVVGIHSRIGRRIVSNFHVPIDQYHTTWDRLVAGQIWGGSLGADEPDQYRALLGLAGNSLNDRCEITQVYRGMPASSAGFKPGDVVTRFGDDEVSSFEDLAQLVLAQKPGNRIKVQVERNGENVTLEVMLGRIQLGFPGEPPAESPS